jgi:hypothetical protein
LKFSPSLVMALFRRIGMKGVFDAFCSAISILMELLPISIDAIVFIECWLRN